MRRNSISALFGAAAALIAVSIHAETITYDFTGTVDGATGIYSYVALQSTITGTYTINLANGIPSQSTLPISTTAPWTIEELTGTGVGIAPSYTFVFSSTAQDGSFAYQTTAGAFSSISQVNGNFSNGSNYVATELEYPTSESYFNGSGFALANTMNSSIGLPILTGATFGTGEVQSYDQITNSLSEVSYTMTSLSEAAPVPLPASAWLMLNALAVFGFMTWRRGSTRIRRDEVEPQCEL